MSLNSLLYPNPLNLNCATLNVTGIASGNVKVAPIVTSSTVFIPNMYVNRSKYCDNANVGNVAGAVITGSTITAASNNVIARGLWDSSGGGSVSTYAGSAPTTGQVLTATSASTATWQAVSVPSGATITNATITNPTITSANITAASDNVIARALWDGSGTGSVSTYAATAPTTGQVLTATSGTTATWQTPAVLSGVTVQNATVTLSAAQIATLDTIPVTVVAAPGAGKIVIPVSTYTAYTYLTSAYTTVSDLQLISNGAFLARMMQASALSGSSSSYALSSLNNGGSASNITTFVNQALIASLGAPISGGLGSIQIDLQYITITV